MSMIVRTELGVVEMAFEDVPTAAEIDQAIQEEIRRGQRALRLATEVGYAKASGLLSHLSGANVSAEQIGRLAMAESEQVDDSLERETEELFERGVCPSDCAKRTEDDTVVVAMDGGLVPDRESKASFEARVGVDQAHGPGLVPRRRLRARPLPPQTPHRPAALPRGGRALARSGHGGVRARQAR